MRVDWRSIGEQWLDAVNLMRFPQTQTLNASVNFRNSDWDFRVYGRNLTDDDTLRNIQGAVISISRGAEQFPLCASGPARVRRTGGL